MKTKMEKDLKSDYRLTESLILTFEGFQREGTLQIVLEDVTAQN